MHYLKNIEFTGRRGTPLTWTGPDILTDDPDAEQREWPVTTLYLFYRAAATFEAKKAEDFRDIADAMTALEEQYEAGADFIELENSWYNKLKPLVDMVVSTIYKANAPTVMDRLAELEKEGKGDDAAEEGDERQNGVPEHQGTEEVRAAAEAGGGDSPEPEEAVEAAEAE